MLLYDMQYLLLSPHTPAHTQSLATVSCCPDRWNRPILNEYAKQRDREKSLDNMTQDELTKAASYDRYFQDEYIFEVLGRETVVVGELLAAALAQLPIPCHETALAGCGP